MEATTAALAASDLLASKVAPETMRVDSVAIEEFFDFANEEDDELVFNNSPNSAGVHQSTKPNLFSSVTLLFDSSFNSPLADLGGSNLTSELCIPYDDLAELEWVSSFAEDSYPSEVAEKIQFISGISARPDDSFSTITEDSRPDPTRLQVPGKARSKRPRTAPGNWTSRLRLVSPPGSDAPETMKKKKTVRPYGSEYPPTDGRKCLHCQTDKTPQWRTGPMGPKTLCNACGVRYKSGRLVPEYRPASSPTFVLTKHSNSHRKVLELRKKNEMIVGFHQLHNQRYLEEYSILSFDGSNGEDFLIHESDFGEVIY